MNVLKQSIKDDLCDNIVARWSGGYCINVLNSVFKEYEGFNVTRRVLDMSDKNDAALAVKCCGLKAVFNAVKSNEDFETDCCAYYHLEDISGHSGVHDDYGLHPIISIQNFLCDNIDEVVDAALRHPEKHRAMYEELLPYILIAMTEKDK